MFHARLFDGKQEPLLSYAEAVYLIDVEQLSPHGRILLWLLSIRQPLLLAALREIIVLFDRHQAGASRISS